MHATHDNNYIIIVMWSWANNYFLRCCCCTCISVEDVIGYRKSSLIVCSIQNSLSVHVLRVQHCVPVLIVCFVTMQLDL